MAFLEVKTTAGAAYGRADPGPTKLPLPAPSKPEACANEAADPSADEAAIAGTIKASEACANEAADPSRRSCHCRHHQLWPAPTKQPILAPTKLPLPAPSSFRSLRQRSSRSSADEAAIAGTIKASEACANEAADPSADEHHRLDEPPGESSSDICSVRSSSCVQQPGLRNLPVRIFLRPGNCLLRRGVCRLVVHYGFQRQDSTHGFDPSFSGGHQSC